MNLVIFPNGDFSRNHRLGDTGIFVPGDKGRRPLTKAMKKNAMKSLEILFEILLLNQEQDYMRYIQDYLETLLQMRSKVFYSFFEKTCAKQIIKLTDVTKLKIHYFSANTRYLSDKSI